MDGLRGVAAAELLEEGLVLVEVHWFRSIWPTPQRRRARGGRDALDELSKARHAKIGCWEKWQCADGRDAARVLIWRAMRGKSRNLKFRVLP